MVAFVQKLRRPALITALLAVQRPLQQFDICIEPPPPLRPDRRPVMTALTLPPLPDPLQYAARTRCRRLRRRSRGRSVQ